MPSDNPSLTEKMNLKSPKSLIINELDSNEAAKLGETWGQSAFEKLDPQADFELLKTRIEAEKSTEKAIGKIVPLPVRRRAFWKIALAAAAVFAGIVFFAKGWSAGAAETQIVETAAAETRKINLPDGTEVWLNERSRLEFPTEFVGSTRSVSLAGEAFFSVKKNPAQPFVVSTADGATVRVLGTRFDVRTSKALSTEVFVEEGRVELAAIGQKTVLAAGQFARFDVKKGQIESQEKAPSQNIAAWKTRQLIFGGATFKEVAQDFERFYGIEIEFEKAELLDCKFTSTFPITEKDPRRAMEIFARTVGATVDFDGQRKAVIRGGTCR